LRRLKNKQLVLLLEKSGELFKKYGIKNLTMDDVAKELGMSKKTIYHFVENKAQLVQLTMQSYLEEERKQLDAIVKPAKNSVDEMIQMISYFFNQVREFNPSALNDLQKYYPETWNIYNEYRFHFMLTRIASNLENGIKQGVYRNDLNPDIISKIYIAGIDILINQDFFPAKKYVFIDTYKEYLNYHLRGIVSAKGLKYLEEHNLFKA
jgi:TetR/AcrR family transcriptional regulator, cholesterol catabolism regulator